MKLLFDENLAPRLVAALAELYPGSVHVRDVGLERADDSDIWSHARDAGLAIVSKDADFQQRSFIAGHPPKVIWVRPVRDEAPGALSSPCSGSPRS